MIMERVWLSEFCRCVQLSHRGIVGACIHRKLSRCFVQQVHVRFESTGLANFPKPPTSYLALPTHTHLLQQHQRCAAGGEGVDEAQHACHNVITMSTIPITALTPENDPPPDKAIRGVVTLFWPYSSSTRQCAFLLADPDFRLRNRQGQVRVRFTGASAEAVAKSRVGIGDEVVLSLNGGSWEEDPEATRTPGKSVGAELYFRRRLRLTVVREGGDVQVNVDAPASPPRWVEPNEPVVAATPIPRIVRQLRGSPDGATESEPGYAYTSPAFVKRLKMFGESLLDSAFDPFAGDTMDVDEEDGRQRTSFGRGLKWRYAAKSPSPTKNTFTTSEQIDQESPSRPKAIVRSTSHEHDWRTEKMPPPPRPSVQLPQTTPPPPESMVVVDEEEGPSTPKLHPVESPTLPLPSPFPVEAFSQSHFDLPAVGESKLPQAELAPETFAQRQGDGLEREASQTERHLRSEQHYLDEVAAHTISQPETPIPTPLTTGFGFGFDGATASAVPQPKVSPQDAEKHRVMAQTFRSLFGFTGSPQGQDQALERTAAPVPALSELEKQRLDASNQVDARSTNEVPTEPSSTVEINDISAATTSQPSIEPRAASKPQSQIEAEVIEIRSSSEEEDEPESEMETPIKQPPSIQPAGRLRFKSPDIPDTYQDSEAEDLTASQQAHDQPGLPELSQAPVGDMEPQHTNESLLQSFLEQDQLYPTLPTEVPAEFPIEPAVKSPSPEAQASSSAAPADQSVQQPSYPSLPISPSNSQSLHDMASQAAIDIPETIGSMFPPTPQLTQVESSNNVLGEMLPTELPVSQEEPVEEGDHSKDQPHDHSQEQVVERPAGPSRMQFEVSAPENEIELQKPQPSAHTQAEVEPQPTEQIDAGRITRAKAKKAALNRVSIIPDAISPYFSPRRSGGIVAEAKGHEKAFTTEDVATNGHVGAEGKAHKLANGFSTALSYFTPLARLDSLLNPSLSQQAYGATNTVDVFAVVTDSTTDPARAKSGPKDYYTIFRITDASLSPQTTRVEVFRPFKNTLPAAKEGDVMLLRAFAVKSRNRQPYLISSDASAWCVFTQPSDKIKPVWARKAGEEDAVGEKVSGPPVEFGQEERDHARDLRAWWELIRHEMAKSNGANDHEDHEMNGMNGQVARPVAAKL